MQKKSFIPLILSLAVVGCGSEGSGDSRGTPRSIEFCKGIRPTDYVLTSACAIEVLNPSRIVLTTDDNSTGGISIVDVNTRTVTADVALSETDSLPYYHDGTLYILHRLGFDRIDLLDPSSDFVLTGQHPVLDTGSGSANAQAVVIGGSSGAAFVSNFGVPELHVYDYNRTPGESLVQEIDLSGFADADGNPEQGLTINCGETIFVSAQLLAPDFSKTAPQILIPVDTASCEPYDTPIPHLGWFLRGLRKDPADSTGHSVIMLTSGIERVNLATGDVSWIISEAELDAEGIGGFQPQSFDFHGTDTIYLAAYRSDYSAIDIWRIPVAGGPMEAIISGLNAREKTLEILGDELWFGDTTTGGEGLRIYDLTQDPPVLVAGPLDVGLPPKSMLAIP